MKKMEEKHTNNQDRPKLLYFLLTHKNKNIYAAGILALATMLLFAHAKKNAFDDTVEFDNAIEQDNTTDISNEFIDEIDNELQQEETPSDNSIYYTDWGLFHIKHIDNKDSVEAHHYSDYVYNEETGMDEATCKECGHMITRKHIEEASKESTSENKDNSSNSATNTKDNNKINNNNKEDIVVSINNNQSHGNNNHNNDNEENHDHGNNNHDNNGNGNNNHNNGNGNNNNPTTPAHTHTWSSWQYYNDSQEVSSCSSCNEKKYQSHSYGAYTYNSATGLEESTCSSCGHVKTRSHTHQYGSWVSDNDATHSRTCTVNGDNSKETASHSYTLISQDGNIDTYQCNDCGHVMTMPHSHNLGDVHTRIIASESECYQTYQVCSGCGQEVIIETKTSHNYGSPSTSESGGMIYEVYTCLDCGYSYQVEHGHTPVYTEIVENVGSDDVCYRVYLHCEYDGCSQHSDILQGEYGHDWQHGSQTIMDTTIEYDECSHCHMRKNEVEIDNSQVRANDYDYYTIYDDIYDNRNKKSKVLTRRV